MVNEAMHIVDDQDCIVKRRYVIINETQKVQVFGFDGKLSWIKFTDIYNYQEKVEESKIRLTFEKVCDPDIRLDFVPIIYQKHADFSANSLMIYDVETQKICLKAKINPTYKL